MAVVPLHGWSSHVGEVRLVVDPEQRAGAASAASSRARPCIDAVELGLAKLVVEVIADQTALIAMFVALGLRPEALLADHVRDRNGQIRDLLVLANDVESQFAAMADRRHHRRAVTVEVDGLHPASSRTTALAPWGGAEVLDRYEAGIRMATNLQLNVRQDRARGADPHARLDPGGRDARRRRRAALGRAVVPG